MTVGRDTVQVEACVRSNRPEDTCDTRMNLCRGPMREKQKVLHSPRGGDYVNFNLQRPLGSFILSTLVCRLDKYVQKVQSLHLTVHCS